MKKTVFFIPVLLFLQNSVNAIVVNTSSAIWSASSGASVFLYGISLNVPNISCTYLFQNSTNLTNMAEGMLSTTTDPNGVFSVTIQNPLQCSTVPNGFVLLVECVASAPYTTTQNVSASVKTISTCTL